eukprot:15470166-Alexandrium_andersonii.AAC.1
MKPCSCGTPLHASASGGERPRGRDGGRATDGATCVVLSCARGTCIPGSAHGRAFRGGLRGRTGKSWKQARGGARHAVMG